MPVDAHTSLVVLAAELQAMQTLIGSIEKRSCSSIARRGEQRLRSIPGIGIVGASAIVAIVPDPRRKTTKVKSFTSEF